MMKITFSIGLLLLYVTSVLSAAIPVKRGVTPADLSAINAHRQELAKRLGIPIPDLVWDEALVAQATAMSRNCDEWMNTANTRFAQDDPDRNGAKMMKLYYDLLMAIGGVQELPEHLSHIDKDTLEAIEAHIAATINTPAFSLGHLELLNPLQTKIGCAKKYCEAQIPETLLQLLQPLQLEGNMYAFYSVCVLGPSAVWDLDLLKKGAATMRL